MANKKINELDSRASLSLSDLMAVGDPSTGYLYKTTISDLKTLTGAGVVSFNGRFGSVVPAEGDYSLTQLSDVIITSASNNQVLRYNGSNWVNATIDLSVYVPYTGATGNVNLGTNTLLAAQIKATSSAGLSINANSGTQIADLGAGGGANMTLFGGLTGTSASFSSSVTGNTIVKTGGTSSQFLKADGSVDSSTYLTTSSAASTYVPYTGATGAVNLGAFDLTVNSIRVGRGAGSNNSTNSAFGFEALKSNTTGIHNAAFGYGALSANTTANDNTAIGMNSLLKLVSGDSNIGLGAHTLENCISGAGNTAIGWSNLFLATGSFNTSVGVSSGSDLTSGQNNIFLGYETGKGITTGSNNTIIGGYLTLSSSLSNNIILADGAGNIKYRWDGTNNNIYGNLLLSPNNTSGGTNFYIGQIIANNDYWRIYGNTLGSDRSEMVFHVGDNAQPSSTTGQRFRFFYDNANDGTAKDVLIVDYNDSTFLTTLTANSFIKSGGTSSQFLKADGSVDSNIYLTTSAASSTYLPLSGGTLTGALIGTSGNFNGDVLITANTGNSPLRFTSTTASSKTGYLYADATIIGITDTLNAGAALDGIFFNSTTKETLLFNNGSISLTLASNKAATFSGAFEAGRTGGAVTRGDLTVEPVSTAARVIIGRISSTGSDNTELIGVNRVGTQGWSINAFGLATFTSLGTGLVYSNAGTLTSTNPSDERLKDNIVDISWGLSEIMKLRPVEYTWKNDKINQGKQYGFIAQEVELVIPELVKEFTISANKELQTQEIVRLGLEKDGIYVSLVKAIQEQQAQIEDLKQKLK
jgi:hypothetical protein